MLIIRGEVKRKGFKWMDLITGLCTNTPGEVRGGGGGSPYTGQLITGLPIIGFVYTYPGHSSMKIRGVLTVLSIPFIDRGEEEKRKADGFNN